MATTPTISDEPEGGKVIEFRVPENFVPPKLRPKLPGKAVTPDARQPGRRAGTITQAELQEHLELKGAYTTAKQDYLKSKERLLEALRSGVPIESGFLAADIHQRERRGRAYEELVVGC